MTLETAEGQIALSESLLASTLAASDEWQELCGAADEAAALNSIHIFALPDPADGASEFTWDEYESYLPFALITTAPAGFSLQRDGVLAYTQRGTLGLTIEAKIENSVAANDSERSRWFLNRLGVIVLEMVAKDSTAGYLTINRIDLVNWEFGAPEDEAVRGFVLARASFVVTYGVDQG